MIKRSARTICFVLATLAVCTAGAGGAAVAELQFKQLTLLNGWVGGAEGTRQPAVSVNEHGVVRLVGAMAGGSADLAFRLPAKYRPSRPVFIPVGMCFGKGGRILIEPDGRATVQAEDSFETAACFTTLEGVTYLR